MDWEGKNFPIMDKNEVIVVVKSGVVQDVFCRDPAVFVRVIDLDASKRGDNFINTFEHPCTLWDEETIVLLSQRRSHGKPK
jgi:hypothetical protein